MIAIEQQTTCKVCGTPIVQKGGKGHRKRIYCSPRCKQIDYRRTHRSVTIGVTLEDEKYIAELERENKDLQERLDLEERFRTDVEVRTFKSWLRTHPQPRDTDFAKRFLDDRDMPLKASRSKYEAQLHRLKYSEEDVSLFREAWKDMLLLQS